MVFLAFVIGGRAIIYITQFAQIHFEGGNKKAGLQGFIVDDNAGMRESDDTLALP